MIKWDERSPIPTPFSSNPVRARSMSWSSIDRNAASGTKRPLSAILLKNLAPARIELFTGFIGSLSRESKKNLDYNRQAVVRAYAFGVEAMQPLPIEGDRILYFDDQIPMRWPWLARAYSDAFFHASIALFPLVSCGIVCHEDTGQAMYVMRGSSISSSTVPPEFLTSSRYI